MGYSLEWAELPEPAASARVQFEACTDLYDSCAHTPRCAQRYFDLAEPHQFHLNAAGMAVCREGMRQASMMFQATSHPFPDWPFAGIEDWHSAEQARRDAYKAAEKAASAQTVPGAVGIPSFKISNNGPWLVTTGEISAALGAYGAAPETVRAELEAHDLWQSWLGWLRECEEHGGFIVS